MDIETIKKQVAEKGYASLTQSQKDIYNSSSQPAPTPAVTASNAGTVTSESLIPAPESKLPTYKPVDLIPITEGALAGANYKPETYTTPSGAVVDAMGNIITPPPEKKAETSAPPEEKSLIDRMKSLMGITGDEGLVPTPPKSEAEAYKEAYEAEELKTKRATISSLNKELADLNAQYQTLKLAEQTIPMQMQEQAEGRGITAGGLQPLTAGELRKNALAMFPVTSRILAVSAQLSAAQNDFLNAEKHINNLLDLQREDAKNQYQYRKDLFSFAYEVATREEEKELRAAEKKEDREYEEKKNFQALKQDYMATATAENDFATATKMAMATDENQLANLLGQIKIAPEKPITYAPSQYQKEWEEAGGELGTGMTLSDWIKARTGIEKKAGRELSDEEFRIAFRNMQTQNITYEKALEEIEKDTSIINKERARLIASEIFGVKEEIPKEEETQKAGGLFGAFFQRLFGK